MQNDIRADFNSAMDDLRFTPQEKDLMRHRLVHADRVQTERTGRAMKLNRIQKVAAVAAIACLVAGGGVFASGKIVTLVSSSNGFYDYKSADSMTEALSEAEMPILPESFSNGFEFDGGNVINSSGMDESGTTVGTWNDYSVAYENGDGVKVFLDITRNVFKDDRMPTERREINGITVDYNYDEYLFLPPSNEGDLDEETANRIETDDHFFVSYGSEEEETVYYRGVSFIKDGVGYYLYTSDNLGGADIYGDTLFEMASELI